MHPRPSPFRLEPERFRGVLAPFARLAERVLGLTALDSIYRSLASQSGPDEFVAEALAALGVTPDVADRELERVPRTGAAIVVANHPFGGLDGLIALQLLRRVRPDVRVLANRMLMRLHPIAELIIPVDPFGGRDAERDNVAAMRRAVRWIEDGHLLIVFPAGEVSHRTWTRRRIADPQWQPHVARLAMRSAASVTPMFFGGQNSRSFQLAGLVHKRLRTAMLPRELLPTAGGRRVPVRIGLPISADKLRRFEDPLELTRYLRLRTEILGRRLAEPEPRANSTARRNPPVRQAVAAPIPPEWIEAELAELPADACLLEQNGTRVFLATARQIPMALCEIGRLREIAFRAVGEGTGKSRDNDDFDRTYRHLFVWDTERRAILGAYRMGLTDELVFHGDASGLYSNTLFRYDRRFLAMVTPGIELGRSFVRTEDQRAGHLPLMLLWRGIGAFLARHPRYHMLFGPVSISAHYDPASLQMMLDHLHEHRLHPAAAKWIEPRFPVRSRPDLRRTYAWTADMLRDLDHVSSMVTEIERDAKGVPVLVKRYLELGGKLAGFNVDPDFGDAVDGLIVVDLRETPLRLLHRYLGDAAAKALLDAAATTDCPDPDRDAPEFPSLPLHVA